MIFSIVVLWLLVAAVVRSHYSMRAVVIRAERERRRVDSWAMWKHGWAIQDELEPHWSYWENWARENLNLRN